MTKHPGYIYSCSTCGGPVTKPALIAIKDKDDSKKAKLGLGGWRCNTHGPVKVNRELRKLAKG